MNLYTQSTKRPPDILVNTILSVVLKTAVHVQCSKLSDSVVLFKLFLSSLYYLTWLGLRSGRYALRFTVLRCRPTLGSYSSVNTTMTFDCFQKMITIEWSVLGGLFFSFLKSDYAYHSNTNSRLRSHKSAFLKHILHEALLRWKKNPMNSLMS